MWLALVPTFSNNICVRVCVCACGPSVRPPIQSTVQCYICPMLHLSNATSVQSRYICTTDMSTCPWLAKLVLRLLSQGILTIGSTPDPGTLHLTQGVVWVVRGVNFRFSTFSMHILIFVSLCLSYKHSNFISHCKYIHSIYTFCTYFRLCSTCSTQSICWTHLAPTI